MMVWGDNGSWSSPLLGQSSNETFGIVISLLTSDQSPTFSDHVFSGGQLRTAAFTNSFTPGPLAAKIYGLIYEELSS